MPLYLFHFSESLLPFRLPEFDSLLLLAGIEPRAAYDATAAAAADRPFLLVNLPKGLLSSVPNAERCVLIREKWIISNHLKSY